MSEPIAPAEPPKRTSLAKCERHGLHYDPAKMSGCVICRREAGGALPAPGLGAAEGGAQPAAFAPSGGNSGTGSRLMPLLVAAGLCLGAGSGLYVLHGAVGDYVRSGGGYSTYDLDNLEKRRMRRLEEAMREINDVNRKPTGGTEGEDDVAPGLDAGPP